MICADESPFQLSLFQPLTVLALVVGLNTAATAANFKINNPAEKIKNPAEKMYNPATEVNNPAANIYNPATGMDNKSPLAAPTQPVAPPEPTVTAKPDEKAPTNPLIPRKNYYFKTVKEYVLAAKKAFTRDDYIEFLSITEDALRRIDSRTLKASKKSKDRLAKYKVFGYGLLEKVEE